MTSINLIPADRLYRRAVRQRVRRWGIRLAALLILLGSAYAGIARLAAGPTGEITAMTNRYSTLQQRLKYARYLIGERDRLASRQDAVRAIRDPLPAGMILEIVGRRITPESYLTYLSLQREPQAVAAKPDARTTPTLNLKGRAPGHSQVAQIISQLSSAPGVLSVVLVSTQDAPRQEGRDREVEFELLCLLQEGGSHD
jgi:hypothetical protein